MKTDTKDIYSIISEKIINGVYSSGYRLVESDLAADFGVSRTPVRLAIERLVSEGLAKHIPNKGAMVRQLSIDDIQGLYRIREVNEGLAARLAAENCTDKDIEEMTKIIDSMENAINLKNGQEYYKISGEFHRYIFKISENDFLIDILSRLYRITSRFNLAVLSIPGRSQGSIEEHRRVLDAIATRNGDIAEKVMKEHIKQSGSFYNDPHILNSLKTLSRIDWNKTNK